MFPTFDVPPQHAETVGARKHRKAKEEEATRRSSTATSQSSGSNRSVRAESRASDKKSGGFGWFGKSKGVQEIPKVPALKTKISEPSPPPPASPAAPPTAPSPSEVVPQPQASQPLQRPRGPDLQYQHQQRFHVPPPLQALPPPPTGALPQLPSPGLSSRGTCTNFLAPYLYDLRTMKAHICIAQFMLFFPSRSGRRSASWGSRAYESTPLLCLN